MLISDDIDRSLRLIRGDEVLDRIASELSPLDEFQHDGYEA